MDSALQRYSRQFLFREIGEEGQRKICAGRVLICGCGALGSALADGLARAGVGFLRIVDRDFVELSNLQRQVLFDEQDIADQLPKAVAAARKLAIINSNVQIEPIVADIDHTNILKFTEGVDLIIDGMDNFETRFLINDASLEKKLPWIYAGCIGSNGQTLTIFPGETACLRCLMEDAPGPGESETCDTAGILGPIISVMTALQITAALKILAGRRESVVPELTVVDVWDVSLRKLSVAGLRDRQDCPACVKGERKWLSGNAGSSTTVLCGRNAVQVAPSTRTRISFPDLAEKLKASGEVSFNPFLLRLKLRETNDEGERFLITAFADGRAIIQGTNDVAVARGLYARYLGS